MHKPALVYSELSSVSRSGFRAYSNVRGVLSHSTTLDFAGLRYPLTTNIGPCGNSSFRLER
jgi:hypothetical protein